MTEYQLPQPGPEHARLMQHVGTWDVQCKFYMDPTQEPEPNAAVETIEAFGPFFTISRFEMDMMGMPFQGRATLGFSQPAQEWAATWIDVMSPHLFHFTGKLEDNGELVMRGPGPRPGTNEMCDWRTVERMLDDDTREFEMFFKPEGGDEVRISHYVYRRRA